MYPIPLDRSRNSSHASGIRTEIDVGGEVGDSSVHLISDSNQAKYSHLRPSTRLQLERWKLYSSYVKTLRFGPGQSLMTLQLLVKAIRFVHDNNIIPQISKLTARGRDISEPEQMTYRYIIITSLFTPSLEQLLLEFQDDNLSDGDAQAFQNFLDALLAHCPRIQDLVVDSLNPTRGLIQHRPSLASWLKSIVGLQQLRTLLLPSDWISLDALRMFGELPMLQQFSLHSPGGLRDLSETYGESVPPEDSNPGNWFHSLENLFLLDVHLTDTFIDAFPSNHGLLILGIGFITSNPNRQLSERISGHFPHLKELSIDTQLAFNIEQFTFETMSPFARFSKLTVLEIVGVTIYNDELRKLLVSWPNLLSLTLIGPVLEVLLGERGVMGLVTREPYGPTLHILGVIAKKLPKLQELNITLWNSSIEDLGHSFHSFETLRSFTLSTSFCNFGQPACTMHQAALYISSVLPTHRHTKIEHHFDNSSDLVNGADTAAFLKNYDMTIGGLLRQIWAFVDVRKDERARLRDVGDQTNA